MKENDRIEPIKKIAINPVNQIKALCETLIKEEEGMMDI